ncbi:hypothetical protein EF910_12175 [Streptomyces sp. WAC07149]|uniref:hypothetical protein n=1 Tax=Streptomyces sp. WAC07149 TaxID=2487425 RepID=UPI000F768F4D|nr:hypothetical protein [Streptomyces sp. WAC07149]RST05902.1 hypothetical protein EF910_12175 [Streptomyces sp. WAC07149]
MGTYHFHGNVNGPGNYGDHGVINTGPEGDAARALRLAAELARWLTDRDAGPERLDAAHALRGELEEAGREQRAPEPGLVRRSLEAITLGLGAGSVGLALAQQISDLIGG